MPTVITYDPGVINAVQPNEGGALGTTHSILVDANLSQITLSSGDARYNCCDVNELTLWSLGPSDFETIFENAGATVPDYWDNGAVWLNDAGDKLIFVATATISGDRFLHVGVAPINDVGVVADPVLTNYLRMAYGGINLFTVVGVWEKRSGAGDPSSVILMTKDFSSGKVQWHLCPSVAEIEGGDFKGSHPGCSGTLEPDQGPGVYVRWTHATASRAGEVGSAYHTGNVTDNPIGFMVNGDFYFVVPRGWMSDTSNGFGDNWADTRPNGGVFTVSIPVGTYAGYSWPAGDVTDVLTVSDDAEDVTDTAFNNFPWTDEYTRIYDGEANGGWITTYCGRPAIHYPDDGLPILLFAIIDGNTNYSASIGTGQRVFYAKVRGYKWTGTAFAQFDTEEGIVLRQGDLGFSGYNFDAPDSQNVFLINGDIYFQINQQTGMGGNSNERSVLTQFGSLIVSETRQSTGSGRVRYVPRT